MSYVPFAKNVTDLKDLDVGNRRISTACLPHELKLNCRGNKSNATEEKHWVFLKAR